MPARPVSETSSSVQPALTNNEEEMPANPTKPLISIDGQFNDWIASERIDYGDVSGYILYAQAQASDYYFALSAPIIVGANTTFWFNTDQNAATGYQIFGF